MSGSDSDFVIKATSDTASAEDGVKALGNTTAEFGDKANKAGDQAADGFKKASEGSSGLEEHLRELERLGLGFLATDKLVEYGEKLLEISGEYAELQERIKGTTDSEAAFAVASQAVLDIAQRTAQPLSAVGDIYVRITESTKSLNLSQQENLALVETLVNAYKLNGQGAEQSAGGVAALARALAEGNVTGKGFAAAIADVPQLADAVSKALGVTRGELLELAKNGQLSSQTVVAAILGAKQQIDEAAQAMPDSVKEAVTRLSNEFESFIGQSSKVSAASELTRDAIDGLANNLNNLGTIAEQLGAVALAKLAVAVNEKISAYVQSQAAIAAETLAQKANIVASQDAALAAQEEAAAKVTLAKVNYDAAAAAQANAQASLLNAQSQLAQAEANQTAAISFANAANAVGNQTEAVIELEVAQSQLQRAQTALTAAQTDAALVASRYSTATAELVAAQNAEALAAGRVADAEAAAAAARNAASSSATSLGKEVLSLNGALQLGFAAMIGYDIGKFLYNQFETARLAGNLLAEGLVDLGATAEAVFKLLEHPLDAKQIWADYKQQLADIDANFKAGRETLADYGKTATATGAAAAAAAKAPLVGLDLLLDKYGLVSDKTQKAGADTDDLKNKLAALTATKLDSLANELQRAFDAGKISATQFNSTIDEVRAALLTKLGVDVGTVRTGISTAMADSIAAIKGLSDASGTTSVEIQSAFNAALSKTTTKEDAAALKAAMEDVRVSGFNAADSVKAISDRANELPSAADKLSPLNQAYKELGITSAATLQRTATAAQDAYDALVKAKAPIGDLEAAFAAMAAKQLAAAAAQGDTQLAIAAYALKGQAATEAESKAVDDLIAKYPSLGSAADDASKKQVKGAKDAADAIAESADDQGVVYDSLFSKIYNGYAAINAQAVALFDHMLQNISQTGLPAELFMERYSKVVGELDTLFAQQKQTAEGLTDALSGNNRELGQTIAEAQAAARSLQYLDQQTLDNLNSAIDSAKSRLQSLNESAQQTFEGLQDQLDQLNNNQDAIQQRQNERKAAEIRQQIEDARAVGDSVAVQTLQRSLALLQQITQVQAQQAAQQRTQSTQTTPSTPATAAGSKMIDLSFLIKGKTITGTFDSDSADALIDGLAHAQSITTNGF